MNIDEKKAGYITDLSRIAEIQKRSDNKFERERANETCKLISEVEQASTSTELNECMYKMVGMMFAGLIHSGALDGVMNEIH